MLITGQKRNQQKNNNFCIKKTRSCHAILILTEKYNHFMMYTSETERKEKYR